MSPSWPKRIVFGHAGATSPNGRQTGIREAEIAKGFWPGTETGENVPRRPLCPRLYERPTDHSAADPRPAGIRRPSELDHRPAGERGRQWCIRAAAAGEVAGGCAPPGDRRSAGVAVGSLGSIGGGPAGNSAGTGAPRRRLRLLDRSSRPDHAGWSRDGRTTGRLRGVRTDRKRVVYGKR